MPAVVSSGESLFMFTSLPDFAQTTWTCELLKVEYALAKRTRLPVGLSVDYASLTHQSRKSIGWSALHGSVYVREFVVALFR